MTQNENDQHAGQNPEARRPRSSFREQSRPGMGLVRLAREISFTPQEPGYVTIEVLGVNRDGRS